MEPVKGTGHVSGSFLIAILPGYTIGSSQPIARRPRLPAHDLRLLLHLA